MRQQTHNWQFVKKLSRWRVDDQWIPQQKASNVESAPMLWRDKGAVVPAQNLKAQRLMRSRMFIAIYIALHCRPYSRQKSKILNRFDNVMHECDQYKTKHIYTFCICSWSFLSWQYIITAFLKNIHVHVGPLHRISYNTDYLALCKFAQWDCSSVQNICKILKHSSVVVV